MPVGDALTAAGIESGRVELDQPMWAEANLSGEDPQARRVEVTMKFEARNDRGMGTIRGLTASFCS